jgi:hypothetical protein
MFPRKSGENGNLKVLTYFEEPKLLPESLRNVRTAL